MASILIAGLCVITIESNLHVCHIALRIQFHSLKYCLNHFDFCANIENKYFCMNWSTYIFNFGHIKNVRQCDGSHSLILIFKRNQNNKYCIFDGGNQQRKKCKLFYCSKICYCWLECKAGITTEANKKIHERLTQMATISSYEALSFA